MLWEPHWSVLNIFLFFSSFTSMWDNGACAGDLAPLHTCIFAGLCLRFSDLISDSGCFVCSPHPVTSSVLCPSRGVGAGGLWGRVRVYTSPVSIALSSRQRSRNVQV